MYTYRNFCMKSNQNDSVIVNSRINFILKTELKMRDGLKNLLRRKM